MIRIYVFLSLFLLLFANHNYIVTYEAVEFCKITSLGLRLPENYPSQMERLSLRNKLLKMEASGKFPILGEPVDIENYNQWKIKTLGKSLGRFLSIIGINSTDSKSSQLHVVIFQFLFIKLRYVP